MDRSFDGQRMLFPSLRTLHGFERHLTIGTYRTVFRTSTRNIVHLSGQNFPPSPIFMHAPRLASSAPIATVQKS